MRTEIRKIQEGMDMKSVAPEELISVQMPATQPKLIETEEAINPPEVIEVSKASFKMAGRKIIVTLKTNSDKPVQFAIGYDKFLTGITAAVAFMNMHLCQFFDLIGGP